MAESNNLTVAESTQITVAESHTVTPAKSKNSALADATTTTVAALDGDAHWMAVALDQAKVAWSIGEVPVGAVVVDAAGEQVGVGYNRTIVDTDPSAHAEVVALRAAALHAGNHRLPGMTLYVTLEPCIMCMGAMLHARLARIVYGATDPKTGACASVLNVADIAQLNHQTHLTGGVLAEPCGDLLRAFFRARRMKEKTA